METIVSVHAVKTPETPTPRTAEMQSVVDAHKAGGLFPRPAPAAFKIGGKLLIHPVLYEELKKHTRATSEKIRNDFENAFLFRKW